ncbi:hypothetical protein [uncultured Maribacter sp.]|uniref:hypothetical protein n=1 Tax=uncultured Maribacter sp. TaxID=431308 RepID=UPI0030DC12CA|tara:strand:- start:10209 stop:10871 length:663 start_codon:yes stop_codon:yes gene_type:complete
MTTKYKKQKAKKKIFLESILVFFIAISPFLYKVYEYLPINSDGSISLLWITLEPNGFEDASFYIWFLTTKIVPLYLLIFWFLTSRDWWYHIIIIPIAMYAFQLFEVIFDSDLQIETDNIWWLIPICLITIPFVYFIRIKLYDKHVHGIDLEAIDAELEELKKKGFKSDSVSTNEESISNNEPLAIPSLSEELNSKLSTGNIEHMLKGFQERIQGWLNFKF